MKTPSWLTLLMVGLACATAQSADKDALDPHLEPLRPWLGKVWKGELPKAQSGDPVIDVVRWERGLNGKAVKIIHSVNAGAYGGESTVRWDDAKKQVTYYYFTTAGFMTTGTMTLKDGVIRTHEIVNGQANDVSEVRGEIKMKSDGTYSIKTEYLKNGTWSPGRESIYREDPAANVVFK